VNNLINYLKIGKNVNIQIIIENNFIDDFKIGKVLNSFSDEEDIWSIIIKNKY